MASENIGTFDRRNFLKLSGAAVIGFSLGSAVQDALAREEVAAKGLHDVVVPDKTNPIRIQFNENALGMSPKAQEAAIQAIPHSNRYPFNDIPRLRELVANAHQVPIKNILFVPGSSDGIRACVAAYSTPDMQFVYPDLTYSDGETYAKYYNLKMTQVPCDRDTWAIDLEGMKQAVSGYKGPSLVYLVNPNNPTSRLADSTVIEAWINSRPANTLFILDEAYGEFVNDPKFRSGDGLVRGGADNVVVLKTFSKIHAMAGMRMGYVIGVEERLKHIRKYSEDDVLCINYPGVMAATASVQDKEFLALSKHSNDVSRKLYTDVLTELGFAYLPSETNFVFHKIPISLEAYQKILREKHIIVGRAFPPADGWCRVSMGTPAEMAYVTQTMRDLRKQGVI